MGAGVMAKLVNYPLLSWKINVQQGLPLAMSPSVIYRGLPMACMNLGGTTAVQFVATGFFQKAIAGGKALTKSQQISAALMGGLVSGIPCSLWELIMTQQVKFGKSLIETPKALVSTYGVGILGRGLIMTCSRESLFTMCMLGLTPMMRREIQVWSPTQCPSET